MHFTWSLLNASVGYPKITKDKSPDSNLTSTRRSYFKLKCGHRSMGTLDAGLTKLAFNASLSNSASHPTRVWGTPHLTRVWATPRPISSTCLSNSALHFRCGSEKLYVSLQALVLDAGLRNPASYFKCGYEQLCVLTEMPVSTVSNARSASSVRPAFLL